MRPVASNSYSFRRELEAARIGGAHGYELLGRALAQRVLNAPRSWLGESDAERLAELVERSDMRAIVRLLVLRVRWLGRHCPARRRYASLMVGVARAVRDARGSGTSDHVVASSSIPDPTVQPLEEMAG